jgi:hypothetical protein
MMLDFSLGREQKLENEEKERKRKRMKEEDEVLSVVLVIFYIRFYR